MSSLRETDDERGTSSYARRWYTRGKSLENNYFAITRVTQSHTHLKLAFVTIPPPPPKVAIFLYSPLYLSETMAANRVIFKASFEQKVEEFLPKEKQKPRTKGAKYLFEKKIENEDVGLSDVGLKDGIIYEIDYDSEKNEDGNEGVLAANLGEDMSQLPDLDVNDLFSDIE